MRWFIDQGYTDITFFDDDRNNIKLINLKKNIGKGYALKSGVKEAKSEWILTSDLDFSVPLDQIFNWIKMKYLNK